MQTNRNAFNDALFRSITRAFAVFVLVLLVAIVVSLVLSSRQTLSEYGWSFLTSAEWDPVQDRYAALVPVLGTLFTSAIALTIAIPVSFGIAWFLTELSPEVLRAPVGTAIEMLAAIPSIIYGMWGLFVFVPVFQSSVQPFLIKMFAKIPILGELFAGPPLGIGIFTAGVILSIMIDRKST